MSMKRAFKHEVLEKILEKMSIRFGSFKILLEYWQIKVQRVLNNAARPVCCAPHSSHITPLMYELHWLPLKLRIHFKTLLFAFKAICVIARTYIKNLVSSKSQGAYNLRQSGGILLASPTFRTKVTLSDMSFQVVAPKLWHGILYRASFARFRTYILLRAS